VRVVGEHNVGESAERRLGTPICGATTDRRFGMCIRSTALVVWRWFSEIVQAANIASKSTYVKTSCEEPGAAVPTGSRTVKELGDT